MCTKARLRTRQAGLTMIELIIVIVVIGVAVAGLLSVMSIAAQRSALPVQHKQALLIAEALVEEVALARFTFCDPDDVKVETAVNAGDCTTAEAVGRPSGAQRPYANVNDYVSAFGDAGAASFKPGDSVGIITDINGDQFYGNDYTAKVTIKPDASLGLPGLAIVGAAGADTDLLHISVTVNYGTGQSITLDRYRTRYAPNSPP